MTRVDPLINERKVLNAMMGLVNPATRVEIYKVAGLPRSTVFDALTRLTIKGIVSSRQKRTKKMGRPKVYFELKEGLEDI